MINAIFTLDYKTLGNILDFMSQTDIQSVRQCCPELENFIHERYIRPVAEKNTRYILSRGLTTTKSNWRDNTLINGFRRKEPPGAVPEKGLLQIVAHEFYIEICPRAITNVFFQLLVKEVIVYRTSEDETEIRDESFHWWDPIADPFFIEGFVGDLTDPNVEHGLEHSSSWCPFEVTSDMSYSSLVSYVQDLHQRLSHPPEVTRRQTQWDPYAF